MPQPSPRQLRLAAAGLAVLAGVGSLALALGGGSDDEAPDALSVEAADVTPSAEPTPSRSATPTATPSATPSPTDLPTATATPSPSTSPEDTARPTSATPAPTRVRPTATTAPRPTASDPTGFAGLYGPLPCSFRLRACPYPGASGFVSGGPDAVTATVLGPGSVQVMWVPWAPRTDPPVVGFLVTVYQGDAESPHVVRQLRVPLASRSIALSGLPEGQVLGVDVQELNSEGLSPGCTQEVTTPTTASATPTPTPTPSTTTPAAP